MICHNWSQAGTRQLNNLSYPYGIVHRTNTEVTCDRQDLDLEVLSANILSSWQRTLTKTFDFAYDHNVKFRLKICCAIVVCVKRIS